MSIATEVWILGSIIIGGVGSFIGHYFGANKRVMESTCAERREANSKLFEEFQSYIDRRFDNIEKLINTNKG